VKRSEWADEWWQRSARDLEAAKSLKDNGFWEACVFTCQQAAEKALKALWTDKRSDNPPRTHRVGELAQRLGAPMELVKAGNALFGDYETSRYPVGGSDVPTAPYTSEDAEDRVSKTEQIIAWTEAQWEVGDDTERTA